MSREIIIWQVWDGEDMVGSDSFFPSRALALSHIRSCYGPVKMTYNPEYEWDQGFVDGDGFDVNLRRVTVRATRAGLCLAMKNIPSR